jgi:hypothetical protein
MNENENKIFIIGTLLCAICLLITLFLWYNRIIPNQKTDTVYTEKTDTFWKDTTIFEKQFIPSVIVKTRKDTLYSEKGDSFFTESKMYEKSFVSDKDTADAKIYVSGIKTSLDSVEMRFKAHTEVITKTIEITKEKPKTFFDRFHLGLQVGYGLGLKSREFEPYVGVGASFDL